MIKMNYVQLRRFNGNASLVNKLFHTPLTPRLSYQNKKIMEDLRKVGLAAMEKRTVFLAELGDKYGKRDEAGVLVRPEGDAQGFDFLPEHREAVEAASVEFEKQEFEIQRSPLNFHELSGTKIELSASEIDALEPLVCGIDGDTQLSVVGDNVTSIN